MPQENVPPLKRPKRADRRRQFDVIRVRDMLFQARHGCTRAEREVGATFRVSVELFCDLRIAAVHDKLDSTIDVKDVYEAVREEINGETCNLIETVAQNIAVQLFDRFHIAAVKVLVHKDRGPIAGVTGGYEVEIVRPWQG